MNLNVLRDLLSSRQKDGHSFSDHLPAMYQYSVEFFIDQLIDQICKFSDTTPSELTKLNVIQFIESHSEYEFLQPIIDNENKKD